MATSCPIGFDAARLRAEVSRIYADVARDPHGDYHFHRGPAYAAEYLGYDRAELAALPSAATAPFAGVGNPHAIAPVNAGDRVVDVGSVRARTCCSRPDAWAQRARRSAST